MITKNEIRDTIENSEIGQLLYSDYIMSAFDLIEKLADKIYKEINKND